MKKSSKNLILFFLLAIVIYPGFTAIAYAQALVSVTFEQTSHLAVGERINVNIQIANSQNVAGYELTVGFDPTALRYIEGANADYLPAGTFAVSPIVSNNTIYIAATSVSGVAAAHNGTLATLTFEVAAAKDSALTLMSVILSDSAGMPLAVTTRNGYLRATRLPSTGDIDGDGKVNILDLTLVARSLSVVPPANPNVDVNKDGIVNISDLVLVAQHLDAVGGDAVKSEFGVIPVKTDVVVGRGIDFAVEEQAIRDLYAEYTLAHGDQDVDALTEVWLPGESKNIFTAWTFWAGTFEKNEGGKAVSTAWDGIFRLRGGKMEVDITYIAIDSSGKAAILRGAYTWGNQKGDLISALKKDGTDWKIRAVDYTDGKFGRQVRDLIEPAHTFGEIPYEPAVATRPPIDFAAEKAAIQAVYSAFYKAFNDNDLKAIAETFRTNDGKVAFGTIFAGNEPVPIAFGWTNVKVAIEGLWIGIGTKGSKWGRDDVLKDFWIRYKGSKIEASAIGYNCYKGSFPGETHLYLMKEAKDGWKIHELDSSTENNLGIFGFHKGKPRLKEAGRFFTTDADKVP